MTARDPSSLLAQVAVRCDWDQAIGNSDMITSAIFGDSRVTLQLGRVIWRSEPGGVIDYWHGGSAKSNLHHYLYYPRYYTCLSTSEPVGTPFSIQREKEARGAKRTYSRAKGKIKKTAAEAASE
jgi:hypothetical protein